MAKNWSHVTHFRLPVKNLVLVLLAVFIISSFPSFVFSEEPVESFADNAEDFSAVSGNDFPPLAPSTPNGS